MRVALAANLSTIAGVQVSPYLLANPTPPAIQIMPGATEYHAAFGTGDDEWWEFTIQAFVAVTTDKGSQMLLDSFLSSTGANSIKVAAESDRTLGGLCDDLIVTRRTGYTLFVPDGRTSVLGAEWTVRVLT